MKSFLVKLLVSLLSLLSVHLHPEASNLGYSVATGYSSTLSASITTSQTFIPVSSLKLKDLSTLNITTLGGLVFLDLEPGSSKEEIVMCNNIDATAIQFTGCTRGLAFSGTSTAAVSANQKAHNSGSTVVMSNVHYVYEQFVDVNNKTQNIQGNKTVTGTWTFNGIRPRFSTDTDSLDPLEFITLGQLARATSTGGVNASVSVRGVVQEATNADLRANTATGTTGARLYVPAGQTTSTVDYSGASAGMLVKLRTSDGEIDSSFCGNPGSCAQLDGNQRVTQLPVAATSVPGSSSSIPWTTASGTLDAWVTVSSSFPFFPNTLTTDNTWNTYSIVAQVNASISAATGYTNGWRNFYAFSGTADQATKEGSVASTTLASQQGYSALVMGTSSYGALFGDPKYTRAKWRMRIQPMADQSEISVGFATTSLSSANPGFPTTAGFSLASTTVAFNGGGNPSFGGARAVFTITGLGVGVTPVLSSVTSNSTAITKNKITGITPSNWNTYEIVYNSSSFAFYVNSVLQFTHTTNIPTTGMVVFGFGSAQAGVNINMTDPVISQQL